MRPKATVVGPYSLPHRLALFLFLLFSFFPALKAAETLSVSDYGGEDWPNIYVRNYQSLLVRLYALPASITVYGGCQLPLTSNAGIYAQNFGFWLGQEKIHPVPIKTGGLSGLLTASLNGFFDGRETIPIEIRKRLPKAQAVNLEKWMEIHKFIPEQYAVNFMTLRKWGLHHNTLMYVLYPGGLGTFDEFFESWNRVSTETDRPTDYPSLVLIDEKFWSPTLSALEIISSSEQYAHLIPMEKFKYFTNIPSKFNADQKKYFNVLIGRHQERHNNRGPEVDLKELDSAPMLSQELEAFNQLEDAITISGAENLSRDDKTVKILKALNFKKNDNEFFHIHLTSSPKSKWISGLALPQKTTVSYNWKSTFMETESVLRKAKANIFLPGDLKTIGQLAAVLDQVQLGLVPPRPIILVGASYWKPLLDAIHLLIAKPEMMLPLISVTDSTKSIKMKLSDLE